MAVDGDDYYEDQPDEDAFIEDTAQPEEEDAFYEDNTPYSYSDDETLDTYLQDFPEEDMELAEALATAIQNKRKKKTPSSTSSSTTNSFPFKAQGEMSFDAKARENRKNAVKFLKSVTPCTSCGRKGHWQGDDECPNTRKKGKGKGKKGSSPKKKPSSTFFVLHDTLESEDEKPQTGDTMTGYVHVSNASPQYVYTQEPNALAGNVMTPEYDKIPAYVTTKEPMDVAENAIAKFHSNATPEYVLATTELYGGDVRKEGSFTDCLATSAHHEVLMVLKEVPMCEHCSYNGGNENKYFRGANGHCRYLTCKERECDKTVLSCRRKEPAELWRYLVVVALCTKFGTAARSRELFSNVCRVRGEALEEREKKAAMRPTKPPTAPGSPSWFLVEPSPSSPASSPSTSTTGYPRARILRRQEPIILLYGISLSASQDLPPFPDLGEEDNDILQRLPSDHSILSTDTPYAGMTFMQVASSAESSWFCSHVIGQVLENKAAMTPEQYRFAFYLYGRLRLVHAAGTRLLKAGKEPNPGKRVMSPDDMVTQRCICVPLSADPTGAYESLSVHDCEVMMVTADEDEDHNLAMAYLAPPNNPPGLAILDSGCARTMRGTSWARAFEAELQKMGLTPKSRSKTQAFKGIGGQLKSDAVKVFPVGVAKIHGELHSAETSSNAPLLLSRPFMQELGTVIDIGNSTVSFTSIDVKNLPLLRTSRGHLAISLLDFDMENISEFVDYDQQEALLQESPPQSPDIWEAVKEGRDLNQHLLDRLGPDECSAPDYVPEGWNPDDWQEHVDFLDTMKQDVQNWESYCARFAAGSGEPPPNNIPDPEDVRAHGRHSDDPKHFEHSSQDELHPRRPRSLSHFPPHWMVMTGTTSRSSLEKQQLQENLPMGKHG